MFTNEFFPRFCESDALGHISNTTFPIWLEASRQGIFDLVHPSGTAHDWPLILARLEQDFLAQTYLGKPVVVNTWVSKVGTKSFSLAQQVLQDGKPVLNSKSIMVWFDYQTNSSSAIPDDIREKLLQHYIAD